MSKAAIFSAVALACASGATLAQTPQPAAPAVPPAQQQKLTIGFVEIEGDPRYEPIRAYERLILKTREHPYPGAQIGIDEAAPLARVLKTDFALERITVKSNVEVAPAVAAAIGRGLNFFLIDAPAEAYKPLAAAVKGKDALLFNVSATDDPLRREMCAAEFVHVMPSRAQLMDGLVQYLVSRKWRDYLVLEGPDPADAVAAKSFEASAKKFGSRIVAHQNFTPGTDPRLREKNDPA